MGVWSGSVGHRWSALVTNGVSVEEQDFHTRHLSDHLLDIGLHRFDDIHLERPMRSLKRPVSKRERNNQMGVQQQRSGRSSSS